MEGSLRGLVGEKVTLQILHIVKQPSNHAGCFSYIQELNI